MNGILIYGLFGSIRRKVIAKNCVFYPCPPSWTALSSFFLPLPPYQPLSLLCRHLWRWCKVTKYVCNLFNIPLFENNGDFLFLSTAAAAAQLLASSDALFFMSEINILLLVQEKGTYSNRILEDKHSPRNIFYREVIGTVLIRFCTIPAVDEARPPSRREENSRSGNRQAGQSERIDLVAFNEFSYWQP